MTERSTPHKRRSIRRWLQSTPRRTFVLYPFLVAAAEYLLRSGELPVNFLGVPLLAWGYLQYRLAGSYRTRLGGGGPGIEVPPDTIVTTGIYRYTRNPMYLGHMIFMAGLIVTFSSWIAAGLLLFHVFWFNARAREDERHCEQRFGDTYLAYKSRVRRWIPGII